MGSGHTEDACNEGKVTHPFQSFDFPLPPNLISWFGIKSNKFEFFKFTTFVTIKKHLQRLSFGEFFVLKSKKRVFFVTNYYFSENKR